MEEYEKAKDKYNKELEGYGEALETCNPKRNSRSKFNNRLLFFIKSICNRSIYEKT